MWPANPLGDCPFEIEWPHVIHEIRRVGRDVIFRCGAMARISSFGTVCQGFYNADIRAVNTYKTLYSVVKRERDDGSGVADLVIV